MDTEDIPILVGSLTKPFGIKGFERADVNHPVFKLRDRYVIFLKSETMLSENIKGETKKFFYSVCVPFYIETLKPDIEFLKPTEP